MDTDTLVISALEEIKDRRRKLDTVIDNLEMVCNVPQFDGTRQQPTAAASPKVLHMRPRRRPMSQEARDRISRAVKARWRKAKRANKASLAA